MVGVFLMTTKGDLSKLSITPLALLTGLLSALGVMFNVILPQRFAKNYGFVPTVGWGMIIAGLFSNFLYPVYEISFQVDAISILICLTIAFLGTVFCLFPFHEGCFLSLTLGGIGRQCKRTTLLCNPQCPFPWHGSGWFLGTSHDFDYRSYGFLVHRRIKIQELNTFF